VSKIVWEEIIFNLPPFSCIFLLSDKKGYLDTFLTKKAPKSKIDGDSDAEMYAECEHRIRELIRTISFLKIVENR